MPDGTLAAIDRFFDIVDHGVDQIERLLNRGPRSVEIPRGPQDRRSPSRTQISKSPTPSPSSRRGAPSTSMTLVPKSRFYIVEAVTPSGCTEFVVTDGGNARTVCPSRAFAEQILRALEKTS